MEKKKLIATSVKTVISGGGAVLGTILAGPLGTVAGGAVGAATSTILSDTIDDVLSRQLSIREQKRIKTIYDYAKEKIQENIRNGKQIRSDLQPEELEDTLLIARSTTDNRKVPLLGNLYANTLCDASLSHEQISYLIKIADKLQYSELRLLSLFFQKQTYPLKDSDYKEYVDISLRRDFLLVLEQIYTLINQNILECEGVAILGITDINPHKTIPTVTGKLLSHFMELKNISTDELKHTQEIINYSINQAKS